MAFGVADEVLPKERQAFEETNIYRKKKGREPLQLDTFLCSLAREHSRNMASGKVGFSHAGFNERAKQVEKVLGTGNVAENVFQASYEADGKEAVQAWINSKDHKENMLGKTYRRVGIGMAISPEGEAYYTQILCN